MMLMITFIMVSCSKNDVVSERNIDFNYGRDLTHEKIVLGERLENPYKTENVRKALRSLYPTKADRVDVRTTDLYVRFLPADQHEYDLLTEAGVEMVDHPLDYEILVEGDWYHDPQIPEDDLTWQYAVVAHDFDFPDIRYEVIDECYISEYDTATRSDDEIDWDAVEREAYMLTGNSSFLSDPLTKSSSRTVPSGRITIVDEDANGGKPFGVSGVRVSCNSFVKFDHAYTDRDGYYAMTKTFSSELRYRLVFKNEKGFSTGFNLVLLPASVSTLGKSGPEGIDMTITQESEQKLFKRCVVNNAAYDYYSRCSKEDMDLTLPPSDLRIWIFHGWKTSSAAMLHHGAFVQSDIVKSFLGEFSSLLEFFAPDLTLGLDDKNDYKSIYSTTCHELAHASHFSKVGTSFWNQYITYIMTSYIKNGSAYGDGLAPGSGHCAVGEMWGYYLESKMYKDRYGGSFPSFGASFWFKPQIFRYLDERGLECSEIFDVLGSAVTSRAELKSALIQAYPVMKDVIEQVFNRY